MRIEFGSRPQRPVPDKEANIGSGWGGRFFAEAVELPAGRYRARIQIMFSEFAKGEHVRITARSVRTGRVLDEVTLFADLSNRPASDQNYLSFVLESGGFIELSGHVAAHCETTLLRYITILDDPSGDVANKDFFFTNAPVPSVRGLKEVNFGTTGICNASCIHCPTNKKTFRMPHGVMSAALFEKIVNELAQGGFAGEIFFGLFAEPFEDPILIDRLKLIKRLLPSSPISIATNAALYDPLKHAEIIEYADHIAMHVEALDPDLYNRLMHPLKADRVIPKINAIIDLARQKKRRNILSVTTPVHKENLSQVRGLTNYFLEKGITANFNSLSSRAWEGGLYPTMSIVPAGGLCFPSAIADTLFIDWDGAVVPCCFDFSKSMPLGNLNFQRIDEVFTSAEYRAMYETFRRGEWSSREACSKCRSDDLGTVKKLVSVLASSSGERSTFYPPESFQITLAASRGANGVIVSEKDAEDGTVVYGPYVHVSPGRYRIFHDLRILRATEESAIYVDVCVEMHDQIVHKRLEISPDGVVDPDIEFFHEGNGRLEFRIFKSGDIIFEHHGSTLVRI
jgi:radical SAM protein with 4Fe4S-binding SPASM domain